VKKYTYMKLADIAADEKRLADQRAASAQAAVEKTGPLSSLDLARGSGSASSERLLQASCTLEIVADDDVSPGTKRQIKEIAYLLRCRADAARKNERQPTPNTSI
jgi:hypothetical protein